MNIFKVLHLDLEVSFVITGGKHAKLSEVFDSSSNTGSGGGAYTSSSTPGGRTVSVPDFGNVSALQSKGSIFDRPGFGSVAFRCLQLKVTESVLMKTFVTFYILIILILIFLLFFLIVYTIAIFYYSFLKHVSHGKEHNNWHIRQFGRRPLRNSLTGRGG